MTVPTGRGPVDVHQACGDVRAELVRVDAKASTLLAVTGVALSAGLAILGRSRLPLLATISGWVATAAVAASVALLAIAIRPRLGGGSGFMHYAGATPQELLDADLAVTAEQLIWMARLTRTKYRCLRWAVDLILAGLAATAATAILTALGGHA
jgi:Pycsar effector protein